MENNKLPKIEEVRHECLGLIGFSDYLVHPDLGKIFKISKGKWLLSNNPKGVGDRGYLQTSLKNDDGKSVLVYEHEAVIASIYGIPVKSWRNMYGQRMEIDHIDRNVKNNVQSNLRLLTSRSQQYSSDVLEDMSQRGKLNKESAEKIREDFKQWSDKKIEFYKQQSEKYGVCPRSIQNIILGVSFS